MVVAFIKAHASLRGSEKASVAYKKFVSCQLYCSAAKCGCMTEDRKNLIRYIAKCVAGCLFMFTVSHWLPMVDASWVLISMVLVLSPNGREAIPLTVIRIKANLMASIITISLLLISPSVALAITLAVAITILACHALKLMEGSRPALAAVIIVAMHPPGEYLWSTAFERVVSVFAGCILALILTFIFHRGLTFGELLRPGKILE